jgi:hypothetical protein
MHHNRWFAIASRGKGVLDNGLGRVLVAEIVEDGIEIVGEFSVRK